MNGWTLDAGTVISLLATALAGISVFFVKRYVDKVERLEADAVRRDEIDQLREDMNARHAENTKKLDDIMDATSGTHRRIDDLYRDLMREKGSR